MDGRKTKKIGIFEYDWSMYGFIKDFIIKLAEVGYSVDIFFKDKVMGIGVEFAKTSEFSHYENIRYFNFTARSTRSEILARNIYESIRYSNFTTLRPIIELLARKIKGLLNKLTTHSFRTLKDKSDDIIDHEILRKSKEIIGESQYLCFIGIEKKGLIWAGILGQLYMRPFLYYSLELYIEDHPEIEMYYHLRDAEKKYHQLSSATIIQDRPRADVLLKSNGVERTNVIYFPISARGNMIKEKSSYLHHKFNINDNKKILLYFGSIYEVRFVSQLLEMAKGLDDDMVLVLHGWGPKKYLDHLQSIADKDKVIFSLDLVAEDEIVNIISSAHIGIALYRTTNSNERLVAFSSVKLAYYTQCGVPVITFDTESSRTLMKSYECGELIHSVDEIPQTTRRILEHYDLYKRQAYSAFEHFYDFDKNFARFIPQFEEAIEKDQRFV